MGETTKKTAKAMIEEPAEQVRLLGLARQAAAACRHHACVLSDPGRYQADQTSIMIACEAAITPYATRLAALREHLEPKEPTE